MSEGIKFSPDARRVVGARARETVADILRSYEQMFGATPQESQEWLKNQVDQVSSLRTRAKGGRDEQASSE